MPKGIPRARNLEGPFRMKLSPHHAPAPDKDLCYQHCRLVCNEGVFTVGKDWRVSSFSPGAQQLFGYSPAEVAGLPLDLLLKDRAAELVRIKQLLEACGDVQEFDSCQI